MTSIKKLIVITGPTGVGKTEVAIKVAQALQCEIISADSRQFFKEISIGTAKPSPRELSEAKHHFVDFISIHEKISAGKFEKLALAKIEELHQSSDYVILTGGSGLYLDAVLKGIDEFPEISEKTKEVVDKLIQKDGIQGLLQTIESKDPIYYNQVDQQNPMRLRRAAEVIIETDLPYSSFLRKEPPKRPFDVVPFCLNLDRNILYERINQRVDKMMALGLEQEARTVFPNKNLQALQTVGYKEFFDFFEGSTSKDLAIDKIKQHTRNYAKRQLTWFKKNPDYQWVDNQDLSKSVKEILNHLC